MLKQTPNIHWVKSSIKLYHTFILADFFLQKFGKLFFWVYVKKNRKVEQRKRIGVKLGETCIIFFLYKFRKKPPVNGFGHNRIKT